MITKRPGPDGRVRVTFAMPGAVFVDSIYVVGDFNDWDERATPLRMTERGWMATVELEAGRSYQFRYLFDGSEWHNDWQADSYEPNAYGGDNSVVTTPDFSAPAPAPGSEADAQRLPGDRVVSFGPRRVRLVPTG